MDTKILEQLGFSKNEIKVYFALLELDQSSATPVVRKSKIPNSKIYPTLEKLIQKGLVSFVIKNKVKHFQASDPRNLIDLIKKKKIELSEQEKRIKDLIPQIELNRKLLNRKQEAKIYESLDGVKAAFNDILNSLQKGDEYYVFTLGQELQRKELILFFNQYHLRRLEKGIKVKLLTKINLKNVFSKYYYLKNKQTEIRYTNLSLPTGVFVYKNKVMTLVWGENPTAFLIESENNYKRYKEFFEEFWDKTKL